MHGRARWCGVVVLMAILCSVAVQAQDSFFDLALRGPRGVWSTGMGLSGVARTNPAVGFSYNPAAFANATLTSVTLFRAPTYSCCDPIVLHTAKVVSPVPQLAGVLGFEVLNDDFGEVNLDAGGGDIGQYVNSSILGFAVAYATGIGREIAVGGSFRYQTSTLSGEYPTTVSANAKQYGLSAGVQYFPAMFDGRLRAGLAVLELGPEYVYIDEAQADPAPTSLRIGVDAELVNDGVVSLPLTMEVSKGLIKRGHGNRARPSWEALFSDWNAVPRDMVLHLGLGYLWQPLALGNGWSIAAGVAVGNASAGPEYPTRGFRNEFTASCTAEIGKDGYSLELGLATRWHRLPIYSYSGIEPPTLPNDMFEATVSVPWVPGGGVVDEAPAVSLEHITLSVGGAFRTFSGWARPELGLSNRDAVDIEVDACFAPARNSALALTVVHTRGDVDVLFPLNETDPPSVYDTYTHRGWTVLSSYRLFPVAGFHSLFIGAGAGLVYDLHSSSNTRRMLATRKALHPAFAVEAGVEWEVARHFVLVPRVRWTLVPGKIEHGEPLRIGAYHAISAGLRVGWRLGSRE